MNSILGITNKNFFNNYWGKKHYLAKGHFSDIENSLSIEQLKTIIDKNRKTLNYPLIRLVRNGKVIPEFKITEKKTTEREGEKKQLSISKLNKLLNDGCTLVINAIERYNDNVSNIKTKFEQIFKETIQVNLYLSQPKTFGFNLHYDPHEVFIIQLAGEKEWELYDFTIEKPLRNQRYFSEQPPEKINTKVTLTKGDVLYVPRGMWHKAESINKSSLHLTVGVYAMTKFDIINRTIQELQNQVRFREYMRNSTQFKNGVKNLSKKEIQDIIANAIDSLQEMLVDSEITEVCNDYHHKKTVFSEKINIPFIY